MIKGNYDSNQAYKRSRMVPNAINFVFQVQLEAIDSLIDDWILILPPKDGKVLLKLGKVGGHWRSLAKRFDLGLAVPSSLGLP